MKRHPLSFLGATITGERGAGKSMYAYKVMAKVYYELEGISEEEAYDKSLKHMIFNMEDLALLIDHNVRHDLNTPVICLDDATVHFCSYKFFTERTKVVHIHSVFDTIRSAVTGLLLTCPTRKLLLSFLRQYDSDYKIKVMLRDNGYQRYARCYRWNYLPDEKKFHIYIPFQDNFSCYVADKYFEPYMVKRKEALELANKDMMKALGIKRKMQEAKKAG